MSEIKLDLIVVNDLNGQLQRLKRSLADVGGDVASAGVSGAIAARRSIGSRLDSTAQRLGRVEAELAQLYTCIAGAIERYRQAEADVVRHNPSGSRISVRRMQATEAGGVQQKRRGTKASKCWSRRRQDFGTKWMKE